MTAVLNPATAEVIREVHKTSVEEVDAVVARAKAAFPAWRKVAPADRARLLRELTTRVEPARDELAAAAHARASSSSARSTTASWSCSSRRRAACG